MSKPLFKLAAASLCLFGAVSASAGVFTPQPAGKMLSNHSRALSKEFTPKALDKDGNMLPDETHVVPYYVTNSTAGVVMSPTGEDWFYTLELDGRKISESEYYTDWDFETFHVKVFDRNLNPIGQAAGTMTRPEGTSKCQGVELGMQLTRSFFNSSPSDYEFTITINFNPGRDAEGKQLYGAKQTTEAYSLTEEVPEGGSKCLFQAPGVINSAINSGTGVSENYVMALFEETTWDSEDKDTGYYNVYKKAGWGTPAEKVTSFEVDKRKAYSDGYNEALPFVMTTKGNDVYVAQAIYEKTFLDDPTAETPSLNTGNFYVITLYKASGNNYTKVSETKIPCEGPEGSDFLFRSYALGNFSGAGDITFEFGDGSTPCYIISVVDSGATDETSAYYAIYDVNGKELARFGNGSDGFVEFTNIPGYSKQYGFDMYDKDGDYCTVLVDYPSLKEVGRLPKLIEYDGDIWTVTSVPDRTLYDGGVYYVASVMPSGDGENGVGNHVAWFTADGAVHHIDHLDLGKNVAKVFFNLQGSVFNPYLFHTNKDFEYLAWIYRWNDNGIGTSLELSVVNSKGSILAKRDYPANGAGFFCYVANTTTDPAIMVSYRTVIPDTHRWQQNNEFIKLPLNNFEGEGTAESPYLIKTYGDLNQMRNNLTSHFRLANSIDCDGLMFRPIEGEFRGTFDGAGFEIKNLTISSENSGAAFFSTLGHFADFDEETPETAVIRNITFSNPTINYYGSNLGIKEFAIVAGEVSYGLMSNVFVVNPTFTLEGVNARFGVLACNAENFTIEACGVKGADINIPLASNLGGLVAIVNTGSFTACSFEGKLSGRNNVGGLISAIEREYSTVTDCHVNAVIEGNTNVGGIAANMNRSAILRALVEGTITCTGDNVGGVVGQLASKDNSEPEGYKAIDKAVVALSEFNYPADAECAHRIVGYSSIDAGPFTDYQPDPDYPDQWNPIEIPAEHEKELGTNYVYATIPAVGDATLATEGTPVAEDDVDHVWFKELGYQFGTMVEMPWAIDMMSGSMLPALYFERNMAVSIIFTPDEIIGNEGETVKAHLFFSGFDITDGNFTASSNNPEVADFNGESELGAENEAIWGVDLKKEGTAELTFTYGGSTSAILYVTVKSASGINAAPVASVLAYVGGVLYAEGSTLAVYDAQGRIVAQGADVLSTEGLNAGIYIVRATSADGTASTLKISVK